MSLLTRKALSSRFKLFALLILITSSLPACSLFFSGPIRNPIESDYIVKNDDSDVLILLLPGISGSPALFSKYGVVDTLKKCQPNADILGVDAHLGYYTKRVIEKRLHQDIILPAREQGKQVWLLGNSLGGFGSLIYTVHHPEDISLVALMAPYLGKKRELGKFIEQDPKTLEKIDQDMRRLWAFYDDPDSPLPNIQLGFGEKDRFSFQQQWLASKLPENQVLSIEGGHRWKIWEQLWPELIANSGECAADSKIAGLQPD